jgi:hypothetical protein
VSRLSVRQAALLIFTLTFAFRCLLAFLLKPNFERDSGEITAIAISIAETGVFGNPYKIPTGPTSHFSPGWPYLMGLLYWIYGLTPTAEAARQIACIVITALQFSLLPWVGALAGLPRLAGLLAGLLGGLLPLRYWVETYCAFGEPYSGIAALAMLAAWIWLAQTQRFDPAGAAAFGLLTGAAMHFNPAVLPVFIALLALGPWLFFPQIPKARYALTTLAALAALALALTPWTIRNYQQFGVFMLMRGNLGLELQVSYCDLTTADTDENIRRGVLRTHHPAGSVAEAQMVRDLGEAAYFKLKMRQATDWIKAHPARSAQLVAERTWLFWSPVTTRSLYVVLNLILVGLALAALPTALKHYPVFARTAVVALLAYPILYYFIQAAARYRYPLEWILYTLAALGLVSWRQKGSVKPLTTQLK